MAAIIKPAGTAGASVLASGNATSSTNRWNLGGISAGGQIWARIGTAIPVAPTAATVVGKWSFVAMTKATGSVAPRWYEYRYETGVWTIENHGSTVANSTAPATSAYIGSRSGGDTDFYNGDIALTGAWNVVLTDDQIKTLAFSLHAWRVLTPKALLLLDQPAVTVTVPDLSGGGANESSRTGTTVGTSFISNFDLGLPSLINRAAILRANHW